MTLPYNLTEKKDSSKKPVKAIKSRVKIYKSIQQALSKGHVGQPFSTERAGRVYVTTKGREKHQAKDVPTAGGRTAKGFTPGSATPAANWDSIKAHSVRIGMKHGKKTSKELQSKYGVGSKTKKKKKRK
jgi:hypothetical protein